MSEFPPYHDPGLRRAGSPGAPYLLSLCMIVRNEEENLSPCLAGIASVVDETVIVDTGSTDRSVETAEALGARVHSFPWIDDFSAARNESIRHARGRYILWLDADDRIEAREIEKIRNLKENLKTEPPRGYALQVICRDRSGQEVIYYQLRIFPRVPGVQFEGAVHEEVTPSLHRVGIGIVKAPIGILHTGYSDPAALQKKARRNLKILTRHPSGLPRPPEDHARLAQCYFGIRDYEACIRHLLEARRTGGKTSPFYKKSYATLADCYLQTDQGGAAVNLLRQGLGEYPDSGHMHYLLGAALVLTGKFQEALHHLQTALNGDRTVEDFPVLSAIDARIGYYMGRCFEGMDRIDDALEAYDLSLSQTPYDFDVLRAYGFAAARSGRIDLALSAFQRAKQAAPGLDRGLWLALANIHAFLGETHAAQRLYEEVLKQDPADPDARSGITRLKK